jgi:type IX secretion system PorP/SprF family membrane protein
MKLYVVIYCFCCAFGGISQDINYSNIQTITQLYNPSLTAANVDLESSISYRNQGKSTQSSFDVYSLSFATSLMPKRRKRQGNLTMGLNVYKEQMRNKLSVNSALISTAYHISVSEKSRFSAGVNYGIFNISTDADNGKWGSQFDGASFNPNLVSGEVQSYSKITKFDVGAGIAFSQLSTKITVPVFDFGLAVFHLNQPKTTLYNTDQRLPMRIVLNSSGALPLGKKGSYIQTSYVFQHQSKFNTNTLGILGAIHLKSTAQSTSSVSKINSWYFGGGVAVRFKDALIANIFVQKSNFKLSFAYDFTTSKLQKSNRSMGAIEFVLQYSIKSYNLNAKF